MSTAVIAGLICRSFAAHRAPVGAVIVALVADRPIPGHVAGARVGGTVGWRLGARQRSVIRHPSITPGEDLIGCTR